jgi:hypothetical protein
MGVSPRRNEEGTIETGPRVRSTTGHRCDGGSSARAVQARGGYAAELKLKADVVAVAVTPGSVTGLLRTPDGSDRPLQGASADRGNAVWHNNPILLATGRRIAARQYPCRVTSRSAGRRKQRGRCTERAGFEPAKEFKPLTRLSSRGCRAFCCRIPAFLAGPTRGLRALLRPAAV